MKKNQKKIRLPCRGKVHLDCLISEQNDPNTGT